MSPKRSRAGLARRVDAAATIDWRSLRYFMPTQQVRSDHRIVVRASPTEVYQAILDIDLGRSATIRWLFRMRGIPSSYGTLEGLRRLGFIPLARDSGREVLMGIVGQFWKPSGSLQRLTPEEFRMFDRRGYAKAVWGFHLQALPEGRTRVVTRTCVQCYGRAAQLAFSVYWSIVGPFSSLVRRQALALIRRAAEASP